MAGSTDPHFHERLIEAGYPHVYWKKDDHPWEEKGNYFEKTVDYATVKESHWQRVKSWWQTVKNNRRLEKENNTCMNLEALERMNLHFLQKQLLDNVASYVWDGPKRKTDATAKMISESLHQYCKLTVVAHACYLFLSFNAFANSTTLGEAVRDREYMSRVASKGERRNPFMLRSDRILESRLMEVMEGKMDPEPEPGDVEKGSSASVSNKPDLTRPKPVLTRAKRVLHRAGAKSLAEDFGDLPGGPWDYPMAMHENALRYGAGVLGVVIFVAPMILMVLVKGTLSRLLTSGLFIVAFALGLAFWSNLTTVELITGTAAYAAVLVVFVGAAM